MNSLLDYKTILLPVQESVAEEAKEALFLIDEAEKDYLKIGKIVYENKDGRFSEGIKLANEECQRFESKYAKGVEVAKCEISRWTGSRSPIYGEEAAVDIVRCGLLWISVHLGRLFLGASNDGPKRWSSDDLDAAVQLSIAARCITNAYCCAFPADYGRSLRDASIKFDHIAWVLVNCRYDDQVEEFALAIDERQMKLNESMRDISKTTEAQGRRMTCLTLIVTVATILSVAVSIRGCVSSHDGNVEEFLAGIEQRLGNIEEMAIRG